MADGTMEQRTEEVRARMAGVTPGPWFVWDGHGYMGGGRDLCIGAGPTWLANMDHRECVRRREHAEEYAKTCAPLSDAPICELDGDITAEQGANAQFIARAREDVPFLLSVIDYMSKEIDAMHVKASVAETRRLFDDAGIPDDECLESAHQALSASGYGPLADRLHEYVSALSKSR